MTSPNANIFFQEYQQRFVTDPTFATAEIASFAELDRVWRTLDQAQLGQYADFVTQKVMQQDDLEDKRQFISEAKANTNALLISRVPKRISPTALANQALTLEQNPKLWQALRKAVDDGRVMCSSAEHIKALREAVDDERHSSAERITQCVSM